MLDTSRFFVADALEEAVRRLEAQDFAGDQARLDVHAQAFAHIAGALHAQGAWTPVFDALCQAVQPRGSHGLWRPGHRSRHPPVRPRMRHRKRGGTVTALRF
ncbi:hypothetical protein P4110_04125 [Pseudomonas aeruginosa]|nr:hypothetical protein [Pseudomonas aeruginosa]